MTTAWDGIIRYDKSTEKWQAITERDGLSNNETNDLLIDDDYIWVSAWGDASRYNKRTEKWEVLSGWRVLSGVTLGLFKGQDGVWFLYAWRDWGKAIATKYHNKTRSWTTLKIPRMKKGYFGKPTQVVENAHSVWFAVENQGLVRYNKASKDWTFFNEENGLADNYVIERSLVVDDDYVWVGTSDGLYRYNQKQEIWMTFTQSPLAQASRARKVYAVAADARYV